MNNVKDTTDWGTLSRGYHLKKKTLDITYKIFRAILLFGLCFLIMQPILDKISISFKSRQDLYDSTVISIPRDFTLDNYRVAGDLINYWPSLFQTLLIVMLSSILQISACTLAGYGFARFKFPFKNFWFMCVMLIIIVPPQTIMSSLYLNFRFLTYLAL